MNISKTYYLVSVLMQGTLFCAAQKHDTLQTVRIFSEKKINPANTAVSVQVLDKDALSKINSISVADAVKYFAGVNVKDYGGIGGLKTVSVRSLGANHTGVMYDGLLIGDAQGGQVDLGKFSLDNISEIQLYTGGISEILSPARAFASASLLSLKTSAGLFNNKEKKSLSIGIKQGSFGYFSPSASLQSNVGKKIQMGFNGFYQYAKGNYPFLSYDDHNLVRRINSKINASRLEYNAAYKINDSSRIVFKAFYYNSKRLLPNSVILFNPIANQRLDDENLFLQSTWQYAFSRKSTLLASGKFSRDIRIYTDPAFLSSYGKLVNDFHQQELYFSAAYKYLFSQSLALSFSSDVFKNKLKRTDIFAAGFATPTRNNFLNNFAVQLIKKYVDATGNLLYTTTHETVKNGNHAKDLNELTGGVSVSVRPLRNSPFRVRGSYQHIFRIPTFDDLYYTFAGNTALRPEYADQYNLGLTFNLQSPGLLQSMIMTTDLYLNNIKDKIVTRPGNNTAQWSAQNIDSVRAKGIDAAFHIRFKDFGKFRITSDISYSFLEALNVSHKGSGLYHKQIPYTPKHSGSADINVSYKDFSFSCNFISSSYRYRDGEQIPGNLVQGWGTNDISFNWLFKKSATADYKIIAEALNIFNTQYEVIKYYPMPRFNYRIGITANFYKTKQP